MHNGHNFGAPNKTPTIDLVSQRVGVKLFRVCSFLWGATMMSVAHCKNRAAECLMAAERSSNHDGQKAWRRLADLWGAWSDTLGRLSDPAREWPPFPSIGRDGSLTRMPELRWK